MCAGTQNVEQSTGRDSYRDEIRMFYNKASRKAGMIAGRVVCRKTSGFGSICWDTTVDVGAHRTASYQKGDRGAAKVPG